MSHKKYPNDPSCDGIDQSYRVPSLCGHRSFIRFNAIFILKRIEKLWTPKSKLTVDFQ